MFSSPCPLAEPPLVLMGEAVEDVVVVVAFQCHVVFGFGGVTPNIYPIGQQPAAGVVKISPSLMRRPFDTQSRGFQRSSFLS